MANQWLKHVKQVKAQNKNLSLKQVLKLAAQSYKKQKQQGGGSCADNAAPVSGAAENFAHGGAEGKDPEKETTAEAGLGGAQAGGKKRRSRKNKQQQGGKKRSRKYKGKKSKRRAAGKKSKRRTRRRRRR